jgi:DNA-binding PadR family transcriptional regulator
MDYGLLMRGIAQDFRRGLLKLLALKALERKDMHGYAIMGRIAWATGGGWKPSPGSIYPALRSLEREWLITSRSESGRVIYHLTSKGRRFGAHVRDNVGDLIAEMTVVFDKV